VCHCIGYEGHCYVGIHKKGQINIAEIPVVIRDVRSVNLLRVS
jgi:hypothetical protein